MKKTWILLLIFFSAGILSYADAQSVKNLNTKEFKVQIWDFEKNKDWKYLGDKPAIIDMYATWCPPCKKLSPILEEIQKEYGDKLQIYKVDVDKEPALAQLFNASSTDALYSQKRQTFYGNRVTSERTNNRHY